MTRHFLDSISLLRDSVPNWSEHPFSVPAIQKQLLRTQDELNFGGTFRLGVQGECYSRLQTELRRRFHDKIILIAPIAADWGASYLPPRELYDTGIYQESIAVVAAGSLEQLIEAVAGRITVNA